MDGLGFVNRCYWCWKRHDGRRQPAIAVGRKPKARSDFPYVVTFQTLM